MIGLYGLVERLLTAKTSPLLDVAGIKGEAEIGAPGPVGRAAKVDNDVRLPSHAALDRLIPAGIGSAPHPQGGAGHAQIHLSIAARAISAVLAQLHGQAGPARGTEPAWSSALAPPSPVLAGTLAQAVSESGLFYESHLLEFASGTRSLEQMMREPQARWATTPAGQADIDGPGTNSAPTPPASSTASPAAPDAPHAPDASVAHAAAPSEAARVQAAYAWAGAAPAAAPDGQAADTSPDGGAAAQRVAGATASAEVVHPHAVSLVQQQLELLATSHFRWSGEAWPGVPLEWSIAQEEAQEQTASEARQQEEGDDDSRRWFTTLAMNLPRLGEVHVRLTLSGRSLQARLETDEATTGERLRADGAVLAARLEAAGLRLQGFEVGAGARP